jgi:prophage antirepressor-like protein
MSKSEVVKYEIVQKVFDGTEIEFVKINNEIWTTARTLGTGLEYANPRRSVMKLFYRNQDEIEEFSTVVTLGVGGTQQETRVFNETGAYLLVMFSKQPKAKEFRKWLAKVAKEIREKGFYIEESNESSKNPITRIGEAIIKIGQKLEQHDEKIDSISDEIKAFEERYENEKMITSRTRKEIQDLINVAKEKTGIHWAKFYQKIFRKFGISSTTDIPEKLGKKIVEWISQNQHKFIYGEKYRKLDSLEVTS